VLMAVREGKLSDGKKKPQTLSLIFANADEFETFVERVHAGLESQLTHEFRSQTNPAQDGSSLPPSRPPRFRGSCHDRPPPTAAPCSGSSHGRVDVVH